MSEVLSGEKQRRVRDVMATDLHSINGLATVADALAVLGREGVSSLVVERRDGDDEVGLVEIADLARVVAQNRPLDRVNVYEVMKKPVVTLPADMLARYAVRLLADLSLTRAVVVDANRDAVGMATLRDLVLAGVAE